VLWFKFAARDLSVGIREPKPQLGVTGLCYQDGGGVSEASTEAVLSLGQKSSPAGPPGACPGSPRLPGELANGAHCPRCHLAAKPPSPARPVPKPTPHKVPRYTAATIKKSFSETVPKRVVTCKTGPFLTLHALVTSSRARGRRGGDQICPVPPCGVGRARTELSAV
jgi:hypothetical protein